jgi:hypothetical protein
MLIIYFLHVVFLTLRINYAIFHSAEFLLEKLIFTLLFKGFSIFKKPNIHLHFQIKRHWAISKSNEPTLRKRYEKGHTSALTVCEDLHQFESHWTNIHEIFFWCEWDISYYSFCSIQKVTGLRFFCAKCVRDKSCRETGCDMRLELNMLSCIRPCQDKLTKRIFMLCRFIRQEYWNDIYKVHTPTNALFTKLDKVLKFTLVSRTQHGVQYTHRSYDMLPHHRITYNDIVFTEY